jgi:Holliday junction resolvase RusA-like endonuclease
MPKSPRIIRTKLPTYEKNRQEWRRKILNKVREAAAKRTIEYDSDQKLEVDVVLYLQRGKRHEIHDVDNRLKDILDSLQGRFRGADRKNERLIANDNKICKAVIEKRPTPKRHKSDISGDTGGWITIRPFKKSK